MSKPQARIIADSVSPVGDRLTTLEVTMHRFVLAEFNTHRVFSRNSASSRAIPFKKQLDRVMNDPAFPVVFPAEQRGMQGGDEVEDARRARLTWHAAMLDITARAEELAGLGVHKSVVNRLLEPFMWHTVIVTATDWDGFWHQRCSPLAQPEIRVAAEAMKEAYDASEPKELGEGMWHLPYIEDMDWSDIGGHLLDHGVNLAHLPPEDTYPRLAHVAKMVSAARCARVSYLTHDGVRSLDKDLELFARLTDRTDNPDDPVHWSPLEHVATPIGPVSPCYEHFGNFTGWKQFRHEFERSQR